MVDIASLTELEKNLLLLARVEFEHHLERAAWVVGRADVARQLTFAHCRRGAHRAIPADEARAIGGPRVRGTVHV